MPGSQSDPFVLLEGKKKSPFILKFLSLAASDATSLFTKGILLGISYLLNTYKEEKRKWHARSYSCDYLLSSHILITQWWNFNFILIQYSNKCSPKRKKTCIYQEILIQRHILRIRIRKCISLLWRIQPQGRRKETKQPLPCNRWWKKKKMKEQKRGSSIQFHTSLLAHGTSSLKKRRNKPFWPLQAPPGILFSC